RNGTEADSFQQHQRLEFLGKYHCREKFIQRAMGIRLCAGGEPAAGLEGFRKTLLLLPPEFYRWRGNVRRVGRSPQFRTARNFALSCTRWRLELAERMDAASFARFRTERQQPQIPAAMGTFPRDQGIRPVGTTYVWSQVMKLAIGALLICAML